MILLQMIQSPMKRRPSMTVQTFKTPKIQQIQYPTQQTWTPRILQRLHKPLLTVILQQAVILKPHLRQRAITTHQVQVGVIQQLLMIMTQTSISIFIKPQQSMIVTGQMNGIDPGQME